MDLKQILKNLQILEYGFKELVKDSQTKFPLAEAKPS